MFSYLLQYFLNFPSSPEKFIELSKFETYPPLLFEIFPDSSQYFLPSHHQSNQNITAKVYLNLDWWFRIDLRKGGRNRGSLMFDGEGVGMERKGLVVTEQQIQFIYQKEEMSLHKHTLSFEVDRHQVHSDSPPILREVIRKTIEHQIHQHVPMAPISLPHQLKIKTKKALGKTFTTLAPPYGGRREVSQLVGGGRRGGTSWSKSRGDGRLNETKRQLQLLSDLYQKMGRDQIKRYQEQLQHEQSQLHRTIATFHFRRSSMHDRRSLQSRSIHTSNLKPQTSLEVKPELIATKQPEKVHQQTQNGEIDAPADKYIPYRRLLLTRRRSKGKVSPWTTSQPTQPN